jgi:glycosyltransferase involved in cell wall biosynthesis
MLHNSGTVTFSIVITCFNYENFVEDAINSVLSQPFASKELIVVDDGSTDRSWEVICRYSDRAKVLRTSNVGQARACLLALKHCRGDYVYFLDADDYLLPDALRTIHDNLDPSLSKLQFSLQPVNESKAPIGLPFPDLPTFPPTSELIESISRRGHYPTPPTSGNVYRRDVFQYIEDIEYDRAIDGISYLLAPFLGKVVHLNQVLAHYRVHGNNASGFKRRTSARLYYEADRFVGRLRHLEAICAANNLPGLKLKEIPLYSFVLEHRILGLAEEGRRPPVGLILQFGRSLGDEGASVQTRAWKVALGLLMAASPRSLRRSLVQLRSDRWARALLSSAKARLTGGAVGSASP